MRECGIVIMEMALIQAKQEVELKKKRWSEDIPLADTHLERRNKRRGRCTSPEHLSHGSNLGW